MLVRSLDGLQPTLIAWVVQIRFVTYILPVLRTITLFGSILLFLSACLDLSTACSKIAEPLCLFEPWRGFNPPNCVLQITLGRYILPIIITTTLFGSILLFRLSPHLVLSMACAKIVEPLCLLESLERLQPTLIGLHCPNKVCHIFIASSIQTTTLFGSVLMFLSAHLDLSLACSKIVEPLRLLEAWRGFNPP